MTSPLPDLPDGAHKGDAGRVLLICGSEEMPGAALLCARAAQGAGAGLVAVACSSKSLLQLLPAAAPEAVLVDLGGAESSLTGRLPEAFAERRDDARIVGCGLGVHGRSRALVRNLITDSFAGPLVLDADALNIMAGDLEYLREVRGGLVLTPHPGEAARLLGREVPDSDEGRIECAREIARRSYSICVLKGVRTIVASTERVHVNMTGNSGMATAGSGDVLAGVLGAYAAWLVCNEPEDRDLFDISVAAAHIHGLAGDLAVQEKGRRGLIASDLIDFLPAAQLRWARDSE